MLIFHSLRYSFDNRLEKVEVGARPPRAQTMAKTQTRASAERKKKLQKIKDDKRKANPQRKIKKQAADRRRRHKIKIENQFRIDKIEEQVGIIKRLKKRIAQQQQQIDSLTQHINVFNNFQLNDDDDEESEIGHFSKKKENSRINTNQLNERIKQSKSNDKTMIRHTGLNNDQFNRFLEMKKSAIKNTTLRGTPRKIKTKPTAQLTPEQLLYITLRFLRGYPTFSLLAELLGLPVFDLRKYILLGVNAIAESMPENEYWPQSDQEWNELREKAKRFELPGLEGVGLAMDGNFYIFFFASLTLFH